MCKLFQRLSRLIIIFSVNIRIFFFCKFGQYLFALSPGGTEKVITLFFKENFLANSHAAEDCERLFSLPLQSFVPHYVFDVSVTLYWTSSRFPCLLHIMGPLPSQRNPIKASAVVVRAGSLVPSVVLFSEATASFASFQGFFSLAPLSRQELWHASEIQFLHCLT